MPANSIFLDGSASSDPDGSIDKWLWKKIGSTNAATIMNAATAKTIVQNLDSGVYRFELTVQDNEGLTAKDTVQVTVLYRPPPCTDCKIVFVSSRDGNEDIYTCREDGSNILRLTYDTERDYQPAWSPDGRRIAFISERTGIPELFIMNADGSNVVQRTSFGRANWTLFPSWSPDGTRIVYTGKSPYAGGQDVFMIGATSGLPSLLIGDVGVDVQPAWSPDGYRIVWVSDRAYYDTVNDIYLINTDGTGYRAVTQSLADSTNYSGPSWSPDGRKLALVINKWFSNTSQVGVINPDGSGLVPLKSGAVGWTKTAWSGDGTRIIYTSLSGTGWDVSWVSADGSSSGTLITKGWEADWKH